MEHSFRVHPSHAMVINLGTTERLVGLWTSRWILYSVYPCMLGSIWPAGCVLSILKKLTSSTAFLHSFLLHSIHNYVHPIWDFDLMNFQTEESVLCILVSSRFYLFCIYFWWGVHSQKKKELRTTSVKWTWPVHGDKLFKWGMREGHNMRLK